MRLGPRSASSAIPWVFVALGVIWGSNFLFMKWATEDFSAAQVTLGRIASGFVPILVFAASRRELSRSHARAWPHLLVMAGLASAIYYWAFAAGTERLPSGIAGALSGAIPLFAFVAALALLPQERLSRLAAVGIVVGFVGVGTIARPWDGPSQVDPTGVALMLLGSASVGLSFVYARRFLAPIGIPPSALTTYQMGLALLIMLIVSAPGGVSGIAWDAQSSLAIVLGLGLLGTGVAYVLYYWLIARLGAVTASSVTYLPPVVAFVIGGVFVGEQVLATDIVGVGLVLVGVLLLRPPRGAAALPQSGR